MVRQLVAGAALLAASLAPAWAEELTVTDLAGREVTVTTPITRAILGEGRQIYMLATLFKDNPIERVVGWRNDFRLFDHDTYQVYLEKFPGIAEVEEFGSPYDGSFSVEQAIAIDADVVTLPLGNLRQAEEAGIIEKLETVGIPVVFVDFRERPFENTIPSIALMGRLFDKEALAQEVTDFYTAELNRVYAAARKLEVDEKPQVFIERAAGWNDECCRTWGDESLGMMIERAGGHNIGGDLVPGSVGTVSPEEVIVRDPDVIILTGANWTQANPDVTAVSLGAGADDDAAQENLRGLANRPGFAELQAVKNGRFHSIWHQFYNSPYNFVALQAMAKWIYPEAYADVDPDETFARFHEAFLPVPYTGGYWASLTVPTN